MNSTIYTQKNGQYKKNNPTWHIEDSPWKAKQVLKILSNNGIDPKTVAEVGCGAGEILNQLHLSMPNNINFTGFDISNDAINFAISRSKERLKYHCKNFLNVKDNFDLLLMMDVFEHVEDYLGFLKSCKNKAKNTIFHIPLDISVQAVLRKNKLLAGRNSVGHLHYFTKETALATLTDCGYNIIDYFYTASTIDLPSLSFISSIAMIPRKLLFKIKSDLASKTLGGFSLLVLTE